MANIKYFCVIVSIQIVISLLSPSTIVSAARGLNRKPRSDPLPPQNEAVSEGMTQQLLEMAATLQALNTKVNGLHLQVTDLSSRNTALEGKLNQYETRILACEATVAEQNKTVSSLETQVSELQKALLISQQVQHSTEQKLTDALRNVSDVSAKMTSVDRMTSQLQTNLISLTTADSYFTDRITGLEEKDREIENNIRAVQNYERSISSNFTSLERQIDVFRVELGFATQRVSFFAQLSHDSATVRPANPIVILDDVILNQGGGYSNETGVFTVPVPGDYFFGAQIKPARVDHFSPRVYFMVDSEERFFTNTYYNTWHVVLSLTAGQQVWIKTFSDSQYGGGTYLTGALIRPVN